MLAMILARSLMVASSAIVLVLGTIHLVYTFWGPRLKPRAPQLQASMSEVSPVLTRQTTMWKAWIGFNASHSMGAMLFGLIYGYMAIAQSELLFKSPFLLAVGFAMVGGFAILGKLYWFSIPFWSACVSLACYVSSIAVRSLA
jgi:hypothetical protein